MFMKRYQCCSMLALTLGGLALTGCSAATEDTASDEDIAVLQELIGSDPATCGSATADKTYTNKFPSSGFEVPATYQDGKNGCNKAYFVDVTNFSGNIANTIAWKANTPSTKAACEGASVAAYVFDVTNSPTFVGSLTYKGIWDTSMDPDCLMRPLDTFSPEFPALASGRNYKFAISARNKDGDVKKMSIRSR